ncbi:MAG: KH domain-containing protein [Terriglobales bacterium]
MTEPTISAPSANVRAMIEKVAKSLVEAPDAVSVTQVEEGPETVLELTVAETDMGKVIGKNGRTVRAMRNLVSAAGVKANKRFVLEIIE